MNVWPEDVETLLRGHPLVQDAAVVAVSKEGGGTSLHAYLIPSGSTTTDQLRGILADCNSRLAQHQRLASASWWPEADFPRTAMLKVRRHLLPRPLDLAAVHVQASHAADDPVSQVVAGAAHVPTVAIDQTLGELGLDSLGLVDLALALEEKTGKAVSDGDLRMEMTVKQVHELVESAPADGARATHAREGETIDPDVPLWPYTLGRPLRVFGILVDLIYALAVNRTLVLGQDNLVDLPSPVIFAGTHHGFGDMPLVRRALARTTGRRRGWRLVTAIAAGGFNSGGPKFGHGMGLYPWYGILALGLFPLRQHAERGESLRRLVQVASAGNDVLIFPQGTHARPADERAGNATVAFHSGVAHLARGLAADVVPFGVAGTERVMPPVSVQVWWSIDRRDTSRRHSRATGDRLWPTADDHPR